MNQLRHYTPAIGWGIFIFILSVIPAKDIPSIKSPWDLIKTDKLVHMLIYGIFVGLILRGWFRAYKNDEKTTNTRNYLLFGVKVALYASLYGLSLEWFQETFCEDRLFEYYDALANAIGAFAAVGIFHFFEKKR